MKIAVTSQSFRTVTGHAGKTRRFLVYSVSSDGVVKEENRLDMPKEMPMHNISNGEPHPLDEMDILVTSGCGEGFHNKMAMRSVKVVETEVEDPLLAIEQFLSIEQT